MHRAQKKEGVCRSVRDIEREVIEMRKADRYTIHVLLFLVGVFSSLRSAPVRKSHVLVSKVLTGITDIATQIIND